GILGHDLRNPLGTIVTGAQVLERQLEAPAQLKNLTRMRSAADRMVRMIEQLLDLTRARAGGGLEIKREPVNLEQLARHALEELRGAHPERPIHLQVEGDTCLVGDADRILQVLSNLVGNALAHGVGQTPVEVRIQGDAELTLEVQNAGVIAPELL